MLNTSSKLFDQVFPRIQNVLFLCIREITKVTISFQHLMVRNFLLGSRRRGLCIPSAGRSGALRAGARQRREGRVGHLALASHQEGHVGVALQQIYRFVVRHVRQVDVVQAQDLIAHLSGKGCDLTLKANLKAILRKSLTSRKCLVTKSINTQRTSFI